MCIIVRAIDPRTGAVPWDPSHLVINIPRTVTESAAAFIVGETLRALGVVQDLESTALQCFCGEPVTVPALGRVPAAAIPAQAGPPSEEIVHHGT